MMVPGGGPQRHGLADGCELVDRIICGWALLPSDTFLTVGAATATVVDQRTSWGRDVLFLGVPPIASTLNRSSARSMSSRRKSTTRPTLMCGKTRRCCQLATVLNDTPNNFAT